MKQWFLSLILLTGSILPAAADDDENVLFTAPITLNGNETVTCSFLVNTQDATTKKGTAFVSSDYFYHPFHEVAYSAIDSTTAGVVTIPKTVTYNGYTYTVTKINQYGFSDCRRLTGIIIPATVKSIDNYAFMNCQRLAEVKAPMDLCLTVAAQDNAATGIRYDAYFRTNSTKDTITLCLPQDSYIAPTTETGLYLDDNGEEQTYTGTKPTALICTGLDHESQTVSTREVSGNIPAGTGIILIGIPKEVNYIIPAAKEDAAAANVSGNLLQGATTRQYIGGNTDDTKGYADYILQDGIFYRSSEGYIDAGKAFLRVPTNGTTAAARLFLGGSETTGIITPRQPSSVRIQKGYDLLGRKVSASKGIIISNHSKYFVK